MVTIAGIVARGFDRNDLVARSMNDEGRTEDLRFTGVSQRVRLEAVVETGRLAVRTGDRKKSGLFPFSHGGRSKSNGPTGCQVESGAQKNEFVGVSWVVRGPQSGQKSAEAGADQRPGPLGGVLVTAKGVEGLDRGGGRLILERRGVEIGEVERLAESGKTSGQMSPFGGIRVGGESVEVGVMDGFHRVELWR